MVPPPVTPSPHRFVAGQRRASSPSKNSKELSGLREHALQSARETQTLHRQTPQLSQFAPTPRFSSGKAKTGDLAQRSPSPPKPAIVQAIRTGAQRIENVDDAPGYNQDDEMLDNEHTQALSTTEQDEDQAERNLQWTENLAFSPKRRRLDGSGVALATSTPAYRPSGTSASYFTKPSPQVTHSQARSAQSSTPVEQLDSQRPSFLRSSIAPHESNEPLPQTFSPHKRGQKFVPGAMAATVQQWVIETGQAAIQSRKGQAYLRAEDYVLRVKVEHIMGDESFTVRGKRSDGTRVKVLLAGEGHVNQRQAHVVGIGCIVGIRAPTWDLELDGEDWMIAVDWRVLSELPKGEERMC